MARVRLLVAVAASLLLTSSAAGAATVAEYAALGPVGAAGGGATATVRLPGVGYPAATLTSSTTSATRSAGTSTWFGATTPPGQAFGSSNGRAYFSIPSQSGSAPSTTTLAFDSPAPVGWGFVLGDIDADQVTVTATRGDGSPATAAELGFRGGFNACTSTPRQSSCGTDTDVPTWDAGTATLTGNPTAANTTGADGWFVPTVALRSLTLLFTPRSGFPSYQVWFASVTRAVSGTVDVVDGGTCDLTAVTVSLLDPAGQVLASTRPDGDGRWSFPRVAATSGLRARVSDPPAGCSVSGADTVPVDLATTDATAAFRLRQDVAAVVTGQVLDRTGAPVAEAVVTLTGPGVEESARTDGDGRFTLPGVPPGRYTATLDPPPDLVVVGAASVPVTVSATGEVRGLSFVVRRKAPAAAPAGGMLPSTGG